MSDSIHDDWDDPPVRPKGLDSDKPDSLGVLFIGVILIIGLVAAFVASCYER